MIKEERKRTRESGKGGWERGKMVDDTQEMTEKTDKKKTKPHT